MVSNCFNDLSTPESHPLSACADHSGANSTPDDPASLRSGLCPGTGFVPSHGVRSIPEAQSPACPFPAPPSSTLHRSPPLSCCSRFPPNSTLQLLPTLGPCPPRFGCIPGDLSPFFRG